MPEHPPPDQPENRERPWAAACNVTTVPTSKSLTQVWPDPQIVPEGWAEIVPVPEPLTTIVSVRVSAKAEARGADALATRARQELYAGGRPRTTALRGPEALTPSERRVVERAAAGQTNRAIAEALFVTPKTVELHLRNAYRKLGARNRHDLATLLERQPAGQAVVAVS